MSDALLQDERVASLTTPLGKNKLALRRFEGQEGLSELFEFRVDALSRDANIDFDKLLGRACTVSVTAYKDPKRHFDGIVVEAQALGTVQDLYSYRLVLRPTLWLLSRTTNCRIWHDKTALDIIKEILSDRGVDFSARTTRTCRTREYCVQYRETDLAYVCRLMEEEGIYYFFEHKEGSHTMVLADAPSSHQPIPGHDTLRFTTATAMQHVHQEALTEWTSERRFRSGKFELRDYNFKTPNNKLIGPAKATASYEKSDMEIYDYPGKYDKESEGKSYAEVRRDAEQAVDQRRYGAGEAPSLFPGGLVTLKEHPKGSENRKYLVIRTTHEFSSQLYRSSMHGEEEEQRYRGSYVLAPSDRPFRAPFLTPKPIVHGPQTARVVQRPNGSGEEIDVDEHGRIRVRFHWDRDDKRSCWVRVAQMWSGSTWGGQFIPRVDMEVVVEFLEGDPDRPLVVGCVYNADNMYPWQLPANKTQSGIKSDSSKGHNGYNQIRFEDKKMSEQIEVHAEKDMDTVIEHAETRKVGPRFDKGPGSPARETTIVMGDDKLTVSAGHRDTTIAMDDKLMVTMNKTSTIALKQDTTIGVSETNTVGTTQSTTVGASQSITVGASQSTTVGASVTIMAGATITLMAGASMMTLGPSGVTIVAPSIMLMGPVIAAPSIAAPSIASPGFAGLINGHP